MKRWTVRWALGAGCLLLCTIEANADQLSNTEAAELRGLVLELRQQVGAQAEQIEAQGNAIHDAEKREARREGHLDLDPFFSSIEVAGWVATSWWFNLNDPPGHALTGANQGAAGTFYPFHPDSNSFEVDQVWFEIEKPVTEESRAGFRLDMLYGLTAAQLGGPSARAGGDSASSFHLYQAYVQYRLPIGGVTMRAGKFATLLGAEVAQTVYNWNVTRGNVYNLLQPIAHYGVIFDG
ncbi:MAG: outer membrane beta-barrel protein, partial [Deltaproteobacteria bacterium]|nr:outer membrane beta-barrel protein [Deltaproteobacteria bacterium]